MRLIKNFFVLSFVFVFLFSSCKKALVEKKYFSIPDATYVKKNFPKSTDATLSFSTIDGSGFVVPGGVALISFETSADATEVYIGVEGEKGYFAVPVNGQDQSVSLIISGDLEAESFDLKFALAKNGEVGEIQTIPVRAVNVGTGDLQVSLSWDQPNDVDLHLVEPDGSEIYYGDSYSNSGGELDLDSNPACSIDSVNNENIDYYLDEGDVIQTGEYIVRVDFYDNCDVQEKTQYSVAVQYMGELISPSSGTNPYYGEFQPEDNDWGDEGSGKEIMKFRISSTKKVRLYSFQFPEQMEEKKVLSPQKIGMSSR